MKRALILGIVAVIVVVAAVLLLRPDERGAPAPAGKRDDTQIGRGEYLALVGDCLACHTVRGDRPYAGGLPIPTPFGTLYTPNITPDPETGIGKWSEQEIVDYLGSGNKPDGDVAGGLMGEVIQGTTAGYRDLTPADLAAVAKYLKSSPPVKNRISK